MSFPDKPAYLGSEAFWNFLSEQESDPVVRRLHEHFGSPQRQGTQGRGEHTHPGS